jgi:hypothetical protein
MRACRTARAPSGLSRGGAGHAPPGRARPGPPLTRTLPCGGSGPCQSVHRNHWHLCPIYPCPTPGGAPRRQPGAPRRLRASICSDQARRSAATGSAASHGQRRRVDLQPRARLFVQQRPVAISRKSCLRRDLSNSDGHPRIRALHACVPHGARSFRSLAGTRAGERDMPRARR